MNKKNKKIRSRDFKECVKFMNNFKFCLVFHENNK